MKKDGHAGGTKFVCGKGTVPRTKASTDDKRYTIMGFTAATGEPVMCVIIFQGVQKNINIEMGVDLFAETEGETSDEKFFFNNSNSKNKRYPGGPTCDF